MYKHIRLVIDFVIATILLTLLSPFIILLAIAIKLDSKGSVFFLQERIGQNAKPFNIIKFRSMYQNADPISLARGESDSRITKVGKIIRACHLDEFAQLINVIKGEMALIGSRPEIAKYVDLSNPRWRKALAVKPGITGLAAIKCARKEYDLLNSSDDTDKIYRTRILPHKLKYDVIYTEKQSICLDLYIIKLTLRHFICHDHS